MSIRDVITSQSRQVVSMMGETWTHYARTGGLDQAPTYSATGTEVTALPTARSSDQVELGDSSRQADMQDVRISDATSVTIGDKIADTGGVEWVIVEQISGDTGTALYRLRRDTGREYGSDRGGRLER